MLVVRTSKTIWEKIQTKVLEKNWKVCFRSLLLLLFDVDICMCVVVVERVSMLRLRNIRRFFFIVFSSISKNWILKITLFFSQQQVTTRIFKVFPWRFFIWILKQLLLFWIVCSKNFLYLGIFQTEIISHEGCNNAIFLIL